MEASFVNVQDNLVFHANIFNYDKNLFTELNNKKLKMTFSEYNNHQKGALDVGEELAPIISFLTMRSTEQIKKLRTLNYELEENYLYLHKDNIEDLQISEEAKTAVGTVLDLLSFSFSKFCEEEELIRQNQEEVANSMDAQKIEISNNVHYDNMLCCLLYLDGICMINIELIKNINMISTSSNGIDLYDFLSQIINSKLLKIYPKEISSHLLCMLLMQSEGETGEKSKELLEWTFQHYLENKRENCLTSNCSLLLSNDDCLDYFTGEFNDEKQCIRVLFDLMLKESNINIIYESLFCIWNISNNKNYFYIFEKENDKYIETIIQTIRTNKIDKIARIGLLTIKNLLDSQTCVEILFNQKFMRTIDILLTNKWNDSIIKELLNFIYDFLEKNYKITNSFEKYVKELEGGKLKQGSLHSTGFWEENYKEFETNHFEYIRRLVRIVQVGKEEEDIEMKCIACFDLGEFARLYPGGASIIEHFGAKESLLKLIQHPHLELKNRALVCLQKIMMRSLRK